MNLPKKLLCTAGVVLLLGSTSLFAADQSARNILNKAYRTIGNMNRYSFTAVVVDSEAGTQNKYTTNVKVDRPGQVRADIKGTKKNRSIYIDNGNFTMIDHDYNYYAQLKTPKTINGTLDALFEKFGIRMPLASLIYSGMEKRAKFKTTKYFGKVDVSGVECDYVAFKNNTREVHVWIPTGDKPLVKVFAVIDTGSGATSRIDTTLTWNKNAKISESDFVFTAPKRSSKISVNRAK